MEHEWYHENENEKKNASKLTKTKYVNSESKCKWD